MTKRLWHWMFEKWIAEVRREARARALDEVRALTWGREIDCGVGVDVECLWTLAKAQIRSGVV